MRPSVILFSMLIVFLDTGLDVMLCLDLPTECITKYFDGLLEMLLIKRKIGVSELWQNLENVILELYTDLENILHKNVITQLKDFFIW